MRRENVPRLTMAAVAVIAAGLVGGCGGGSGGTKTSPTDSQPSGSPARTAAGTVQGGVLTFAISHRLGVLDQRTLTGDFLAEDLMYEPLVRYGPGGKLEPALATKWTIAPDGKSATFDLRQNVTFWDGTPWDAKAAKWNFDQWVGNEEFAFVGSSVAISKVEILSPNRIRLNLKQPYSTLLQELTLVRPVRFSSPTSVDAQGKFIKPIGTGPYELTRSDNRGASFKAFPKYWGEAPGLQRIEMKFIDDPASRLLALRAGEVDATGGEYLARIAPAEATQIQADSQLTLVDEPATSTLVLAFNFARAPGNDKAVRNAVASGIDRNAIVEGIYRGLAKPATGLFPDGIPNPGPRTAPAFDPDAAKQSLEQAAGGKPVKMKLIVSDDVLPGSRLLSQQIQASLKPIGIDVEIQSLDATTYTDRLGAGDYDLAFNSTYGAPYDPLISFTFLFSSAGDLSDGRIFQSKELDGLIQAAQQSPDEAGLAAGLDKVYRYLEQQRAFVPLVWPDRLWAYGAKVQGMQLAPTEYGLPIGGLKAR